MTFQRHFESILSKNDSRPGHPKCNTEARVTGTPSQKVNTEDDVIIPGGEEERGDTRVRTREWKKEREGVGIE